MAQRFVTKKPQNRYIRPICNTRIKHYVSHPTVEKVADEVEKNNENTEDMADNRINQIKQVITPASEKSNGKRRNARVEKKADGLYEHAQDAVTVLTEDDRMLLKD